MSGETRRQFVGRALASLGAAIALSACGPDSGGGVLKFRPRLAREEISNRWSELESALRDYFGADSMDQVGWVGRAYVQRFAPNTAAVAEDLSDVVRTLESSGSPIRSSALSLAVRRSFEENDLVSVHGWRLSRAEARLAALLDVILHSSPATGSSSP